MAPQQDVLKQRDLATENEDLKQRLELAEQRLRAITPAAEIGVWLWPDVSQDALYVDEGIRRGTGLPADREWFGADEVFGALHPDDGPRVRAAFDAAIEAGGAFEVTHRLRPRDGRDTPDYVRINGEVVRQAGRAALARGTSRLVSRERELSRERDRVRTALARIAATGGVQIWEWPALHKGAIELNGLLHDAAPDTAQESDPWEAFIHPDDLARFRTALADIKRGPSTFEIEVRMSFDGEPHRWQLVHGSSETTLDDPRALKASGTLIDIEDRKRYQEQLERANEKLTLVTSGVSSGVWDWPNMDENYISFSAEMREFMGYPDEECAESAAWFLSIVHPEDLAHVEAEMERVRKTGGKYAAEFRIRLYEGRYRWVRAAGIISLDGGSHRLTGAICRTSTTASSPSAASPRPTINLHAFADIVAHDLSAPMRHVSAFADILREEHGADLGVRGRRLLDRISRAVDQSAGMIADLLEYSRTGTSELHLEEIDLGDLCVELQEQLTAGGEAAHVTWDIGALPTVMADRTHMMMLFQNLLANAVKFTTVTPAALVSVQTVEDSGPEEIIVVRDNGVGFDQAYGKHIFEAFARAHTRSEFAGTGIGLANVARIVARHDGRIEATGEVGKGAEFRVFMPRA